LAFLLILVAAIPVLLLAIEIAGAVGLAAAGISLTGLRRRT
jgi:hypothetical protein